MLVQIEEFAINPDRVECVVPADILMICSPGTTIRMIGGLDLTVSGTVAQVAALLNGDKP